MEQSLAEAATAAAPSRQSQDSDNGTRQQSNSRGDESSAEKSSKLADTSSGATTLSTATPSAGKGKPTGDANHAVHRLRRSNSNEEQRAQPVIGLAQSDRVRSTSTGDMTKVRGSSTVGEVRPLPVVRQSDKAIVSTHNTEARETIANVEMHAKPRPRTHTAEVPSHTRLPPGSSSVLTNGSSVATHSRPPLPTYAEKKPESESVAVPENAAPFQPEQTVDQTEGPERKAGASVHLTSSGSDSVTEEASKPAETVIRQPDGPVADSPSTGPSVGPATSITKLNGSTAPAQQQAVPTPPAPLAAKKVGMKTKKKGRFTLVKSVPRTGSAALEPGPQQQGNPAALSEAPSNVPLPTQTLAPVAPSPPTSATSPQPAAGGVASVTKGRFTVSTGLPPQSAAAPAEVVEANGNARSSLAPVNGPVESGAQEPGIPSAVPKVPPSNSPLPTAGVGATVTKGRFKVSTAPTHGAEVAGSTARSKTALPAPLRKAAGNRERTQSTASNASVPGTASSTDAKTVEATTVPVIKKKGRFVVTNVVTMVPVAQEPVHPPVSTPPSATVPSNSYMSPTVLVSSPGQLVQQPLLYGAPLQYTAQEQAHTTPPVPNVNDQQPALQMVTNPEGVIPGGHRTAPATIAVQNGQSGHLAEGTSRSAPSAPVRRPTSAPRHAGFAGQPGMGKTLYFLDQMKAEVIEADKTIKNLLSDNKFLKTKVKEKEAEANGLRKQLDEEKRLREASELKVKNLRRKLKALKQENLAGESIVMQNGEGSLIVPEGRVSRANSADLDAGGSMYMSTSSLTETGDKASQGGDLTEKKGSDGGRDQNRISTSMQAGTATTPSKDQQHRVAIAQDSPAQSARKGETKGDASTTQSSVSKGHGKEAGQSRSTVNSHAMEVPIRQRSETSQPSSPHATNGASHSSLSPSVQSSAQTQPGNLQQMFAPTSTKTQSTAPGTSGNANIEIASNFDPLHSTSQGTNEQPSYQVTANTSTSLSQVMNPPNSVNSNYGHGQTLSRGTSNGQAPRPPASSFDPLHQPQQGSIDSSIHSVEQMQMHMMPSTQMYMMNQGTMAVPIVGMTTGADGTANLVGLQPHAMMQMAGQHGYSATPMQGDVNQPQMMHTTMSPARSLQDLQQPMLLVSQSSVGSQVMSEQHLMAIHQPVMSNHGISPTANDWNQQGQWSQAQAVTYQQQMAVQPMRPEYVRGNSGTLNSNGSMQTHAQQRAQWAHPHQQQAQWSQPPQGQPNIGSTPSQTQLGQPEPSKDPFDELLRRPSKTNAMQ